MNNNYMKLQIQPRLENVFAVRMCVSSFLSNINICYDELMDIKTALSEAVTNAIEHGYTIDNDIKDKFVVIECSIKDGDVQIVVEDKGNGINDIVLATTPAYTTKPDLEHVGMGFTIMNSFMDKVDIESSIGKGTKITMNKILKSK